MNYKAIRSFAALLAVLLGFANGHDVAMAQSNPYPNFPIGSVANNLNNGQDLGTYWMGGDSPYGLYYTNPTTGQVYSLWTFRDTFLTPPGSTGRILTPTEQQYVVGNTVAMVTYNPNNFSPTFYYGNNSTPQAPAPFFQYPGNDANRRYWPNKAFVMGNYLFVTLSIIDKSLPATTSQNAGTDIARISNYMETPDQWNIEYFNLCIDSGEAQGQAATTWFGIEALTQFVMPTDANPYQLTDFNTTTNGIPDYAMLYGYCNNNGVNRSIAIMVSYNLLANTPANTNITNCPNYNSPGYQIFHMSATTSGSTQTFVGWSSGLISGDGSDYFDIGSTSGPGSYAGYSVSYNATIDGWQLVGVAGNGGSAQYFVNPPNASFPTATSSQNLSPATSSTPQAFGPLTPTVWVAGSSLGPFVASEPLNYDFRTNVLFSNSSMNQQVPPSISYGWQYTQCYGIRQWQLDPYANADGSVFFTFTYGSSGSPGNTINTQDILLYQTGFGGYDNPF